MTALHANKAYTGVDRRSMANRRGGSERRNLVRYESIGSDRRMTSYRRREDAFWLGRRP